jgi:CBS domain-containing protein
LLAFHACCLAAATRCIQTAIRAAAQVLTANRVGALPVTEGDALVGILTRTDVLEAFVGSAQVETVDRAEGETVRATVPVRPRSSAS